MLSLRSLFCFPSPYFLVFSFRVGFIFLRIKCSLSAEIVDLCREMLTEGRQFFSDNVGGGGRKNDVREQGRCAHDCCQGGHLWRLVHFLATNDRRQPREELSQGVAGGRRDQNAEVEHGLTSATGDWVTGPVSIEMWSMIFAGTTCSPCHVDPSSGLHSHFAFFKFFLFVNI